MGVATVAKLPRSIRRRRARKRAIGRIDEILGPHLVSRRTVRHGSAYGGWTISPNQMHPGSIVYSFGLGEDVTFDLELIDRYGVDVHAFELDPRSLEWLARQDLPAEFKVHPYGLGVHDGEALIYPIRPPADDGTINGSRTLLPDVVPGHAGTPVRVSRLTTIMSELGHERVDVLKLDIEGAEYDVIRDVLAAEIPIGQLLVEFHHHLPRVDLAMTLHTLDQLIEAGFRPFAASEKRTEVSFIGPSGT